MNEATLKFVSKLKKDKDVLGIILSGSWARGNNNSYSDVDLIVIKKEGAVRKVEIIDGQNFEMIYSNPVGILEYWKSHLNDAAILWSIAKILYDADGTIKKLKKEVEKLISLGRKKLDKGSLKHLHFDAQDQIRAVKHMYRNEPEKANFILTNKIFVLSDVFFQIRGLWTPAPKQRLEEIAKIDKICYNYYVNFYGDNKLEKKIDLAQKIIKRVFGKN